MVLISIFSDKSIFSCISNTKILNRIPPKIQTKSKVIYDKTFWEKEQLHVSERTNVNEVFSSDSNVCFCDKYPVNQQEVARCTTGINDLSPQLVLYFSIKRHRLHLILL